MINGLANAHMFSQLEQNPLTWNYNFVQHFYKSTIVALFIWLKWNNLHNTQYFIKYNLFISSNKIFHVAIHKENIFIVAMDILFDNPTTILKLISNFESKRKHQKSSWIKLLPIQTLCNEWRLKVFD